MINAKMVKPRIFPWNSDRNPSQIDRLQEISGDLALNRDKIYEIGRVSLLGYRKRTPTLTGRLRQFENGSMDFWYDLANKETPGSGDGHSVKEIDMETTITDITTYLTDDNDDFTGSIRFPRLRLAGFTINVGDPDAMVERNFNVVSEGYDYLKDNYFSYQKKTALADADLTVVLSPVPVEYAAGDYIFRVLRVRGSVATVLSAGIGDDNWSYVNGTHTLTVNDCLIGDIVKVYFASATAYETIWTDNNSDANVLLAEYCEIYMKIGTSERIYRLQSLGIDVTFERTDYKEIGNNENVQEGVKQVTTKISLNRFVEGMTFEQILADNETYPYLNPDDFSDNIQMIVKIFGEKEHTNFKIGYLMNKISPTAVGNSQVIQDYLKATVALEADNFLVSDLESEIVFA